MTVITRRQAGESDEEFHKKCVERACQYLGYASTDEAFAQTQKIRAASAKEREEMGEKGERTYGDRCVELVADIGHFHMELARLTADQPEAKKLLAKAVAAGGIAAGEVEAFKEKECFEVADEGCAKSFGKGATLFHNECCPGCKDGERHEAANPGLVQLLEKLGGKATELPKGVGKALLDALASKAGVKPEIPLPPNAMGELGLN